MTNSILFNTLSIEQQYAYLRFKQGRNLFITGPGGTGKTRLIQFIAQHMEDTKRPYQVCAMTGCAAVLLNCSARTLHSWSGIKRAKGPNETIIHRVMRNDLAVKAWRKVSTLIIDEVSMMSAKMLHLLDDIGRSTRRNTRPFGGIQIILTGDFYQLPPIGDHDDPASRAFCFESPRWPSIFPIENCVELCTIFRQTDPVFTKLLLEIREGKISEEGAAILRGQVHRDYDATEFGGIVPTKIFPVRAKVDYTNNTMYAGLESEEMEFVARVKMGMRTYVDSGLPIPSQILAACDDLTPEKIEYEVTQMLTDMQVEETVRFKVGTLVMCTVNLDVEAGICNGAQGIIVDFVESDALNEMPVALKSGAKHMNDKMVPLVRFANGATRRIDYKLNQCDEYPVVVVAQIPLRLAWALTIHKMQGSTVDMAEMDIGKTVFEYGQTYVALSRVKTLAGVYLTEFYPHKIRANPAVISFYSFIGPPEKEYARNLISTELVLDEPETTLGYPRLKIPVSWLDSFGYNPGQQGGTNGGTNTNINVNAKAKAKPLSVKEQILQKYGKLETKISSPSTAFGIKSVQIRKLDEKTDDNV
jgi:ATP-dependent DNA helicase PIF1